MPLPIILATEAITIVRVILMMYTTAGWGKSSIGFTADDPLSFDFDKSAHRSEFRRDTVPAWQGWDLVAGLVTSDLDGRRTAVVDTTGRALDVLTEKLEENQGNCRRGGGLSQNGYGALKSQFLGWMRKLLRSDLDVILLCHDKEDRRPDDTTFYRPDIIGASYSEVFKVSDAVCYGYYKGGKRFLSFVPCDAWVGKNPAHLEAIEVPDFHQAPRFLAGIMDQIRAGLGKISAETQAVSGVVAQWGDVIETSAGVDHLNTLLKQVTGDDGETLPPASLAPIKRLLYDRARVAGFEFDKGAGLFIPAPKPEPTGDAPAPAAPAPAPPLQEIQDEVVDDAAGLFIPAGGERAISNDSMRPVPPDEAPDPTPATPATASPALSLTPAPASGEPTEMDQLRMAIKVGREVEFIHPTHDDQRVGKVTSLDLDAGSCVVCEKGKDRGVRVAIALGRIVALPGQESML
jgi:hypothetical protein